MAKWRPVTDVTGWMTEFYQVIIFRKDKMPTLTAPLARDSTGPAVAELHSELLKLGARISADEVTAKTFGEDTEKAVKAFQKKLRFRCNRHG